MIRFEGVRAEHVAMYWPHVVGWVNAAIKDAGHCWTLDDVAARLDSRLMQLWCIWDGENMVGCLVTETYQTARGFTCGLPIVYCSDMEHALPVVLDTIEPWARSLGCVRLQGEGRRGWERALRPLGWKTITTQVEKVL